MDVHALEELRLALRRILVGHQPERSEVMVCNVLKSNQEISM